jgi:hypothetical protein
MKLRKNLHEKAIRKAMKLRVIEIVDSMDAYSISKFLSYLLTMNDIDHEILPIIQDRMMQIINNGQLGDIEIWDFKDIVKIFSLTSNERDNFIDRVCDQDRDDINNVRTMTDIELKSSIILDSLVPYIMYKVIDQENVSLPLKVSDISEIIYCYARSKQLAQRDIYELLSDKVANLIKMREDFTLPDATKTLWAVSKYYTNNEIANFNADLSSIIYPRHEYAKVKSVKHRNFEKIIQKVMENKEMIQADYIPILLYS